MPTEKTTCPICETLMPAPWVEYPDYPFCSRRCRTIDLGRWISEDYKVADRDRDDNSSAIRDDEE
jgi:uncharacterized protein